MPEPQRVVVPALESTAVAEIVVSTEVRSISLLPAVRMLRPDPDTSDNLREQAKDAARHFNNPNVWLRLAAMLEQIRREHAYKRWGFRSLSAYAVRELDITKGTASDLLIALDYVMRIHPDYLRGKSSTVGLSRLPPYSSIAALARNTKCLPQYLIAELDRLLFSGRLTRAALQERINWAKSELRSWQPGQPRRRSSVQGVRDHERDSLIRALEALFTAINLDDLWRTTTAVFEDWETNTLRERERLLVQLIELIKHLTDIEELLEAERE